MRLTNYQLQSIKSAFLKNFTPQDHIWLFGSRVDEGQKGGDLDLYIEVANLDADVVAQKKISFLVDLKKMIGDQKIDVVINHLNHSAHLLIYDEAKNNGVKLI